MRSSTLVLATVVVLGVLVNDVMPQGIQIDNNALFALGAVVVASGVAYHVGRNHGNNQSNGRPIHSGGFGGFPFFGRRRRQAEAEAAPLNELDPMVPKLFQMALASDDKGCSLQLACSVGSKPSSTLSGHAKDLHGLLKDKPVGVIKDNFRGLDAYRVALNLGRDGGDCNQLFPKCPNASSQLFQAFQAMHPVQK